MWKISSVYLTVQNKKLSKVILDNGSERAQKIASHVLKEVYDVTGLNL